MMLTAPIVIVALLALFALGSALLRRRFPLNDEPLVDTIDHLLPQTQCAQCGYPGCRPYAEAIAAGAPTNLCPPGGRDTHAALDELMGTSSAPPELEAPGVAVIDEANCIGCTLCLPPCPVDAIVGAQGLMHNVIPKECTGCALCVPACPVDCISMEPLPIDDKPMHATLQHRACISCARCVPACPVNLDPERLYLSLQHGNLEVAASLSLDQCIECGLCDRSCPSEIPLAETFRNGKKQLAEQAVTQSERVRLKARHEAHLARLEGGLDDTTSRRSARMQQSRRWE